MSERYQSDWLALRREADSRARDRELIAMLGGLLAARERPLIADLGCGAGALRAALEGALPAGTRWRMIDRDPALLDLAQAVYPDAEIVQADLAKQSDSELAALLEGADAVAATAFYDLASEEWIARLIAAAPEEAAFYAAITYDGREVWSPPTPHDSAVLSAFHRHQARDFGLGPALGPNATARLAALLEASGRRVRLAASDWRLIAEADGPLMGALASGIAEAAGSCGAAETGAWRAAARRSATIGHWDLLAAPGDALAAPVSVD